MAETKLEALESLLSEIDAAVRMAMETFAPASGMAAILRQKRDTMLLVYEERARMASEAAAANTAPMSEDDVIDATICDLAALPDPMLDRVLNGLVMAGRGAALRRCAPASLRVVGED